MSTKIKNIILDLFYKMRGKERVEERGEGLVCFRLFCENDIKGAAYVDFASFHADLKPYIEEEKLQDFSLERFEGKWKRFYENNNGRNTIVAESKEKIIGVVKYSFRLPQNAEKWLINTEVIPDYFYYNGLIDYKKKTGIGIGQIQRYKVLPEWKDSNIAILLCILALDKMKKKRLTKAIFERNILDKNAMSFQKNCLLGKDLALYTRREIQMGTYGAKQNIDSKFIVSYFNIESAIERLDRILSTSEKLERILGTRLLDKLR